MDSTRFGLRGASREDQHYPNGADSPEMGNKALTVRRAAAAQPLWHRSLLEAAGLHHHRHPFATLVRAFPISGSKQLS
jgi:hypothetical protein